MLFLISTTSIRDLKIDISRGGMCKLPSNTFGLEGVMLVMLSVTASTLFLVLISLKSVPDKNDVQVAYKI